MLRTFQLLLNQQQAKLIVFVKTNPFSETRLKETFNEFVTYGYEINHFNLNDISLMAKKEKNHLVEKLNDSKKRLIVIYEKYDKSHNDYSELLFKWDDELFVYVSESLIFINELEKLKIQNSVITHFVLANFLSNLELENETEQEKEILELFRKNVGVIMYDYGFHFEVYVEKKFMAAEIPLTSTDSK